MKSRIEIVSLTICIIFGLPSLVTSQEGRINIGKLTFIPGLTFQELYDDNIYLGNRTNTTTELDESDLITHVMPAIGLDYAFPERGRLNLGYNGDFAYYRDNNENDWRTHKGTLGFDYRAPAGILLGVNNIYTDAEDPYGNLEQYRIGLKTKRWNDDLKTKAGYDFGNRSQAFAYYNYYKQDYELARDYTQDYEENELGLGYQMRVLPKTWGFARFHLGERYYFTHPLGTGVADTNDSDFTWRRLNAGLAWEPGAKLSGELNLGYQWNEYDNRTDVNGSAYEDKNTWIAATSLTYAATSTTALALRISRALRETGSNTNEYFEDAGIGLSLQQKILTKYTFIAGIVYSVNDYNVPLNNAREDDNYNVNVGIDYRIRDWLRTGAGYRYKRKDSNYPENNFTDNQFLLYVRGVY